MPRKRNPNRDKAFEIYKENSGAITNREIANQLDVPEKTISAWKSRDKWLVQIGGEVRSTTKKKRSTSKKAKSIRATKREQVVDALVEAGTYSPALDLLIEIYLDCYEVYLEERTEKLRKELAKYLGQLGLDGKNKDLIKKNGKLLAKGDEETEEEQPPPEQVNELERFRQRMSR